MAIPTPFSRKPAWLSPLGDDYPTPAPAPIPKEDLEAGAPIRNQTDFDLWKVDPNRSAIPNFQDEKQAPPPLPELPQQNPLSSDSGFRQQGAPPPLPSLDPLERARQVRAEKMAALDSAVGERPELKRASGWKGALQAVGDVFVNPRLMHPKYAQQMDRYEDRVQKAQLQAKLADEGMNDEIAMAKNQRDAETQRARQATEATQGEYYRRQMEKMDKDKDFERRLQQAEQLGLTGDAKSNYVAGRNVAPQPTRKSNVEQMVDAEKNYLMLKARADRGEQLTDDEAAEMAALGARVQFWQAKQKQVEAGTQRLLRPPTTRTAGAGNGGKDDANRIAKRDAELRKVDANLQKQKSALADNMLIKPADRAKREQALDAEAERARQNIRNSYQDQKAAAAGSKKPAVASQRQTLDEIFPKKG